MLKNTIITIITYYQKYISPLKPPTCRFIPTCSSYAIQAIETYGVFKGLGLSIFRVLKCHPFHPGGYHPIMKKDND
ncbi:MAG: membrane protein insertion efficiency factor YidD [Thermodesulfobacteriota bacterium]|nr:membrane protein insertion efficiency factor YidD [Thermodesulfobacteriota bacterium]